MYTVATMEQLVKDGMIYQLQQRNIRVTQMCAELLAHVPMDLAGIVMAFLWFDLRIITARVVDRIIGAYSVTMYEYIFEIDTYEPSHEHECCDNGVNSIMTLTHSNGNAAGNVAAIHHLWNHLIHDDHASCIEELIGNCFSTVDMRGSKNVRRWYDDYETYAKMALDLISRQILDGCFSS